MSAFAAAIALPLVVSARRRCSANSVATGISRDEIQVAGERSPPAPRGVAWPISPIRVPQVGEYLSPQ